MKIINTGSSFVRRVFDCFQSDNYENDMTEFFLNSDNYKYEHYGHKFAIIRFHDDSNLRHLFYSKEVLINYLTKLEKISSTEIYLDYEIPEYSADKDFINIIAFKDKISIEKYGEEDLYYMESRINYTLDDLMNYKETGGFNSKGKSVTELFNDLSRYISKPY
jgi:hypothetical protein